MSQAEFEIKITPDGEVTIDVHGAKGKNCIELSKFLEEALGDVTDREFKSEYYQDNTTGEFQHQQY